MTLNKLILLMQSSGSFYIYHKSPWGKNCPYKRTFLLVCRHPDFNPWNNGVWFAQIAAQASIDYELELANTFQIYKILHNRSMDKNRFSVMSLMLYGK